jgi:hypothetical protein
MNIKETADACVARGTAGNETRATPGPARLSGIRTAVLSALVLAVSAACVVPIDTGANAAAMAMEEVDAALYSMRDETALLQAQIDSLALELKKTDSLLRWLANLTGNPIVDPVRLYVPPPVIPPPR